MLQAGSGKIIFTASLLSFQGGINVPSYAASKGGIARLTEEEVKEAIDKCSSVSELKTNYMKVYNWCGTYKRRDLYKHW